MSTYKSEKKKRKTQQIIMAATTLTAENILQQ